MDYSTPPPPPPPPTPYGPAGGGPPWYKTPAGIFAIGVVVAAAIAIPVLFIVFHGGGNETAGATSTTIGSTVPLTVGTTTPPTTIGTTIPPTTIGTTIPPTTIGTTVPPTIGTTVPPTIGTTVPPTIGTTAAGCSLDYSLTPNYQTISLTSGFLPDPAQYSGTSGGPCAVSYLGDGCIGYATSAPDFRLNYSAASSMLRFYFVANDDTALVVNDPYGNWHCGDDSYGTLNPTVDFDAPAPGGTYDIWIASYDAGTYHDGTLSITEVFGNHP
jgi:hypothetical protein